MKDNKIIELEKNIYESLKQVKVPITRDKNGNILQYQTIDMSMAIPTIKECFNNAFHKNNN